MSSEPFDNYKLPEGWKRPDANVAHRLNEEFERELPVGHLLQGIPVEAFAWTHGSNDDVLFRHLDKPDRFTIVHLSWKGHTEINANYPAVRFDGCFADFLKKNAEHT